MNFHETINGRIVECYAHMRHCPRKFHTNASSQEEAERNFEKELENNNLFPENKKQVIHQVLKKLLNSPQINNYSTDELIEIGECVNYEILTKLSFDPSSIKQEEYTDRHTNELQEINRQIFSRYIETGDEFSSLIRKRNYDLIGQYITCIPNSLKHFHKDEIFEINSIDSEDSGIHGKTIIINEGNSIFNRKAKTRFEVYLPQRLPDDDLYDTRSKNGTVIHEFAHVIAEKARRNNRQRASTEGLFYSHLRNMEREEPGSVPFPIAKNDSEEATGEKILGYSSEEFFIPGSISAGAKENRPLLYGADRAKYADDVLYYTIGFWFQQDYIARNSS